MAAAAATAMPPTQYSRMPEITIMPARVTTSTSITPSAGSRSTSRISGAAASAASPASFSPGRPDSSWRRDSSHAADRTSPSLANSDGSIWNPPGSAIQAFAPFTLCPAGESTASSNSRAAA